MRDERLNRMWASKKVRFLRPAEDDGNEEFTDGFFNVFALHQNRDLGRGPKNCVQESMIPEWMDLVVWVSVNVFCQLVHFVMACNLMTRLIRDTNMNVK